MQTRHETAPERPDRVDQAGQESFPASDPPSWTLGLEPKRGLDDGELRLLRAMLVAKRDELKQKSYYRIQRATRSEVDQGDIADAASRSTDIADELSLAEQEQALLGEIQHALAKFDTNLYGYSELSGLPISFERLRAVPWARADTPEAERQERERRSGV